MVAELGPRCARRAQRVCGDRRTRQPPRPCCHHRAGPPRTAGPFPCQPLAPVAPPFL